MLPSCQRRAGDDVFKSTSRVLVSGEATSISGATAGVYLFRNTSLPEPAA